MSHFVNGIENIRRKHITISIITLTSTYIRYIYIYMYIIHTYIYRIYVYTHFDQARFRPSSPLSAVSIHTSLFCASPGAPPEDLRFLKPKEPGRSDSTWRNFGRFRGGRALIWQPITMPPAIATNPAVAELRSGCGGRIGTNSGGGVRFGTTL